MKGNKKLLIIAIALVITVASYTTYAIYKSSASASDTVTAAAWVITVGDGTTQSNIVTSNTFSVGNISWNSPTYGQNGTIAPGDTGTITIKIDADGSQVGVHYDIVADTTSLSNSNFTITPAVAGSLSGNIPYSATEGDMERTITLNVTWSGVDSVSANEADTNLAGTTFALPVTVTVTQNPNPVS